MTASKKLAAALARIDDPVGEGARAYLTVYRRTAAAEAAAADARAAAGLSLGPLDGTIVSIKDLYDVAGEPTRSGSRVHADAPPATHDAPPVRRLRAAGAVIVGKTNMTEFAFSGIGINPHYGTPGNPFDRSRVPGGSSSGGAVSVADGMAEITIGSDTGGSTRIPAAFCGIVGFKPTQRRIPRDGAFPLSPTLDTVGPMAPTVATCALADAVMACEEPRPPEPTPVAGLRLGVVTGLPREGLDREVAADFERALTRLSQAGARLIDTPMPLLAEMQAAIAKSNFAAVEVFARLEDDLTHRGDLFDQTVRARMEAGRGFAASDFLRMQARRFALHEAYDRATGHFDALVMPTVPLLAPRIADLARREDFVAANMRALRNTSLANYFDLPSISLPMHDAGAPPTGFMLFGQRMRDRALLAIAAAMENLVRV